MSADTGRLKFAFNPNDPIGTIKSFENVIRDYDAKHAFEIFFRAKRATRTTAAIAYYYHSLNSLRVSNNDGAKASAAALAVLMDDFTDAAAPHVAENGRISIPRSYLSKFPDVERLYQEFQAYQQNLKAKFSPTLMVGGDAVVAGLGDRVPFKRREGLFDYWPSEFHLRKDALEQKIVLGRREAIAETVIDDLIAKILPSAFRKRSRQLDSVITFGSCFAGTIAQAMELRGIRCRSVRIEEAVNTTRADRLLLDYILAHQDIEWMNLMGNAA